MFTAVALLDSFSKFDVANQGIYKKIAEVETISNKIQTSKTLMLIKNTRSRLKKCT
jgi:hypothetical protein